MVVPSTVEAFAPAKVNLTLHVTGQRADGYHLLDSLVLLVDVGDRLRVNLAAETALQVSGPHARGVPADSSNLVSKAAALMNVTAEIALDKNLPAAAGIGGGSSDAAAALRALSRLADIPLPDVSHQTALGADVPVCMHSELVRMRGIGDHLEVVAAPPDWPMILVNPGVSVSTQAVFQALACKDNAPMPAMYPSSASDADQINWIATQRNDLEAPAIATAPVIESVLKQLGQAQGCLLARMSGSGATCFAIMSNVEARDILVARLRSKHPDWWVEPTQSCGAALI